MGWEDGAKKNAKETTTLGLLVMVGVFAVKMITPQEQQYALLSYAEDGGASTSRRQMSASKNYSATTNSGSNTKSNDAQALSLSQPVNIRQDTTRDDFQLAREQSYGFFDDIRESDWRLYQQRAREHSDHADPQRPNMRWPKALPALFYMANYDPIFTCPHIRRMGGLGDGPKWTCDPHRLAKVAETRQQQAETAVPATHSSSNNKNNKMFIQSRCLIYSIGCAGKYQWEEALAHALMKPSEDRQTACEIHVFDMSGDYTKDGHADKLNIHFHKWGLKSTYDDSMTNQLRKDTQEMMYSLEEMMAKLGHTGHVLDIFKVDCEFCEWFSYKDWLEPTKTDIRQLLLETHNLPMSAEKPQLNKGGHWFPATSKLTPSQFFDDIEAAGFAMYSKEPNIHPQAQVRTDGKIMIHPCKSCHSAICFITSNQLSTFLIFDLCNVLSGEWH